MDVWIVESCAQNIVAVDILEAVCSTQDKAHQLADQIKMKSANEFLTVTVRKVKCDELCGPFINYMMN